MQIAEVKYVMINDANRCPPAVNGLPFTKRYPYNAEKEVRIIYESNQEKYNSFNLPIDISSLQRVTLSPWLPLPLRDSLVKTIKQINGCEDLQVYRSTLLENERWKRVVDNL
jgi:hypothetical protein